MPSKSLEFVMRDMPEFGDAGAFRPLAREGTMASANIGTIRAREREHKPTSNARAFRA
jgi:hypothetical protein